MSNVLSKLLADVSSGRQSDGDRWDAVCQRFVARSDSLCAVPGGVDAVTAGVPNAV